MRFRLLILGAVTACALDPQAPSAVQLRVQSSEAEWGPPVAVAGVNTTTADMAPEISKDGEHLYFGSPRGDGVTFGIWVAERGKQDDGPWATQPGPIVTRANQPSLAADQRQLFFNSASSGLGGQDIFAVRREDKKDDTAWGEAVNLGASVNSSANDVAPAVFQSDEVGTVLYFASNRTGGVGGDDIYSSELQADGTFGPAVLETALSSASNDNGPALSKNGLEIFIVSDRLGTVGALDIWVSTRASLGSPWSTPVNLGPVVNSTFNEGGPSLSHDGRSLYFHSNANRPGRSGPCFGDLGPCFFDNYVTTRDKKEFFDTPTRPQEAAPAHQLADGGG